VSRSEDEKRLQRHLRALAAVNRQLRAQLDALEAEAAQRGPGLLQQPAAPPPPTGGASRRGRRASEWLSAADEPTAERPDRPRPFLATRPDGGLYLVDGGVRRRIRSGLLVPALEQLLGERVTAGDEDLAAWPEGPPVEVLEGPTGPPFVVVGGRRLALIGLPLPHGVDAAVVDRLPEGPALDLVGSAVPARASVAVGWLTQLTAAPPTDPFLVIRDDGRVFLVEATTARPVRSGLLARTLEHDLGPARPADDDEFATWAEGLAVELLEGRGGPPFVVVGGRRRTIVGIPLPHPVTQTTADQLAEGPTLDVNAATAPPPVPEVAPEPVRPTTTTRVRHRAERLLGSRADDE
jgi:hypothetical protein